MWRMFYTGASFPAADSDANVETICVATSADLFTWTKDASFTLNADPRYYEKLGESAWMDEAWRDPWVYRDPSGNGWQMLITARAKSSDTRSGGVVGRAWSSDLEEWSVLPPWGPPAESFPHLEVTQLAQIDGRPVLLFCGPRSARAVGEAHTAGVWVVDTPGPPAPLRVEDAQLLAPAPYYAGRIVRDRSGGAVLLAFIGSPGSEFLGAISDPIALESAGSATGGR
jgi:beta-fructofuranosidase